jgi:bis(5'-adenosyl)-triphosphatase
MSAINRTLYFHNFVVTRQVFYTSPLSFAFVNIRPLLPGHVLVSPIRPVERLSGLTDAEAADLLLTVKRVGRMLERFYHASALTIPLQDGIDAGQSVPHVHFHIIPRTRQEVEHGGGPDAVYDQLEDIEGNVRWQVLRRERERRLRESENTAPLRSDEAMWTEAKRLEGEMANQLALDTESKGQL